METSPIAQSDAAASTAAAAAAASTAADPPAISSDFNTFLTLLTAQLKNQDPLEPLESTQFVAQLAQFSAVEQQTRTNSTLESILEALGGGGAGLTDWLGASVEAAVDLRFEGAPIPLTVDADPEATSATLIVRDQDDRIVARQPAAPGATALEWDGSTTGGGVAPDGIYRFVLRQAKGDEPLPDAAPRGFANVVEARVADDGGGALLLDGGGSINIADVAAVRPRRAAP